MVITQGGVINAEGELPVKTDPAKESSGGRSRFFSLQDRFHKVPVVIDLTSDNDTGPGRQHGNTALPRHSTIEPYKT